MHRHEGFNAEHSEYIQVKGRRTKILNNWTRKEGAAGKGGGEQRKTPFSRVECFATGKMFMWGEWSHESGK